MSDSQGYDPYVHDPHGAVGAYVADALDDDERTVFEQHLEGCENCRREVAEFTETAAELTWLSEATPPPSLRTSVLWQIATVRPLPPEETVETPGSPVSPGWWTTPEASTPGSSAGRPVTAGLPPLDPEATVDRRQVDELAVRRQRRTRRILTGLVAAALVLVVGLGGWVSVLRGNQQNQQVATQQVNELLTAPDAKVYATTMNGAPVSFVVSKERDQALFLGDDIPPPVRRQGLPALDDRFPDHPERPGRPRRRRHPVDGRRSARGRPAAGGHPRAGRRVVAAHHRSDRRSQALSRGRLSAVNPASRAELSAPVAAMTTTHADHSASARGSRASLAKGRAEVAAMFDRVAERYDLANDVLSLGQDRAWRKLVLEAVDPQVGDRVLDLAAGTGTSSEPFAAAGAFVVPTDISLGMLTVGKRRSPWLAFVAGDGLQLPYADDSFDAVTISFGLRNVSDTVAALTELRRVTKPGGRLVVCEFSTPTWTPFRVLYRNYLVAAIPRIARIVSSNPVAYEYLAESILGWPDQAGLATLMQHAGWQDVAWRNLSTGIVALAPRDGTRGASGRATVLGSPGDVTPRPPSAGTRLPRTGRHGRRHARS